MRRSGLRCLLILLIAGQSLMAMADLRSLDQFGGTDSELSYQLDSISEIKISSARNTTAQNSGLTIVDCLDCGYCDCCCNLTLSTFNVNTSFDGSGQLITNHKSFVIEIPRPPPFLRPPKI